MGNPRPIVLLIFFLLIPSILFHSYAQNPPGLTVKANKETYQPGDKVVISGSVLNKVNSNPVTIIVRNPMGNVYEIGQVNLENNLFVHDFILSENSMSGNYTLNVKYGTLATQFHFELNTGFLIRIPVLDSEIKVWTNDTNLVKYGNASVSRVDNSIEISMDTSKITSSSVNQQYQIPKKVIDNPGSQILTKVDGNKISCTQSETDTLRILDCAIPSGSKQLELFGTMVIPEFGPLTGLMVSIALIVMVVISRTSRIHLKIT
jgi:hypothetical protein